MYFIIYSDEDNAPMNEQNDQKYTGYINGKEFKETGLLIVKGDRNDGEIHSA